MATTIDKDGSVLVDDPDSIKRFQLIALRGALKLQAQTGMEPNHHTNPRAIARKLLGIKARSKDDTFENLINGLTHLIDEVTKKVEFVHEGQDPDPDPNNGEETRYFDDGQ